MAHRDPLSPTPMPTILRYGIAVLSVAIAVVLDFFVLRQFEAVLTPFLFAVAATVWYAGTGPGVLAIVLSLLSLNYFFLPPVFSFSPISYADFVYLAFCTFCALAVGWVSTVRRRTEQELRLAHEELEATVAERTASLRRSEAYLAEAQRLSHCGVTAYKGSTVFYGSEEIYRIWGFDPAQGVPSRKAVLQRIHPDDRDRLNAEVERALGEKRRYSTAYRIVLPDGTVKHLESIGQPVFSANGELVEVVATQIDVTERKCAEEALRESEAKFRDYAESASDWYWETDPDHKFTRLTEDERRLARGLATVTRIGVARWEFATDVQSEPEKWELHRSMLKARQPFRDFVYRATHSDGSVVFNKISGKPVFDAKGELRGYRGTGADVTALRTAEEEARENEQRYRKAELELAHANRVATMGQLTASITHEVNQPITAAITYALAARRFLSAEPPNFREVDDALSLIVKEGNRAGEVIGRVRALVKKMPARKDAVAINDAILEVIALTRTEAANNSVSVRTQFAEDLPRVQGDRVQLQQVMLNLIVNAIQSMSGVEDGNRELHISTVSIEQEGAQVAVRDTGHGLCPESLPRLFEPFYTTKPDGMGMGLSICRSIIEAHGGRLWATRCEPRGALFQFTIPAD